MRWTGRRESQNVEDVRGRSFSMGRGVPIGCGGILLVVLIAMLTGTDPSELLSLLGSAQQGVPPATEGLAPGGAPQDELGKFASVVLADTEETWRQIFADNGLETGKVSACDTFRSGQR